MCLLYEDNYIQKRGLTTPRRDKPNKPVTGQLYTLTLQQVSVCALYLLLFLCGAVFEDVECVHHLVCTLTYTRQYKQTNQQQYTLHHITLWITMSNLPIIIVASFARHNEVSERTWI